MIMTPIFFFWIKTRARHTMDCLFGLQEAIETWTVVRLPSLFLKFSPSAIIIDDLEQFFICSTYSPPCVFLSSARSQKMKKMPFFSRLKDALRDDRRKIERTKWGWEIPIQSLAPFMVRKEANPILFLIYSLVIIDFLNFLFNEL